MLTIGQCIGVVLALVFSVRQRFFLGAACALAIAYVIAAEVAVIFAARASGGIPAVLSIALLVVGSLPIPIAAAGRLPLLALIAAHPIATHVACIALASLPYFVVVRRAAPLRPETTAAVALERLSRPFLAVAVIDAFVVASTIVVTIIAEGS